MIIDDEIEAEWSDDSANLLNMVTEKLYVLLHSTHVLDGCKQYRNLRLFEAITLAPGLLSKMRLILDKQKANPTFEFIVCIKTSLFYRSNSSPKTDGDKSYGIGIPFFFQDISKDFTEACNSNSDFSLIYTAMDRMYFQSLKVFEMLKIEFTHLIEQISEYLDSCKIEKRLQLFSTAYEDFKNSEWIKTTRFIDDEIEKSEKNALAINKIRKKYIDKYDSLPIAQLEMRLTHDDVLNKINFIDYICNGFTMYDDEIHMYSNSTPKQRWQDIQSYFECKLSIEYLESYNKKNGSNSLNEGTTIIINNNKYYGAGSVGIDTINSVQNINIDKL